ncbi:MAG: diguanylate cyclase domain-containing protein [Actinomycetes bacterium]
MTSIATHPAVITSTQPGVGSSGLSHVVFRVDGVLLRAPFGGAPHPEDHGLVRTWLTTSPSESHGPLVVRWLLPDGEQRFFEIAGPTIAVDGVEVHGWDVTHHIRLRETLEHLALHDPLTGLVNRVLFGERVHDELRRRLRTGREVAVLFADLDGFKQVNDAWGHAGGDLLLTTLADRLRETVRPGDIVARLGGDEFAICCPDLSSLDDAVAVANRVIDCVTAPVPIGSTLVRVTVAVGIALADTDEPGEGAELIARADLAMYAAKAEGRARVAVAPPAYEGALSSEVSGRESGLA